MEMRQDSLSVNFKEIIMGEEQDFSTMSVEELQAVKVELEKGIAEGEQFLEVIGADNSWRDNSESVLDELKLELDQVNNLLKHLK